MGAAHAGVGPEINADPEGSAPWLMGRAPALLGGDQPAIRNDRLWVASRLGGGAHAVTSSPVAEDEPDWGPR